MKHRLVHWVSLVALALAPAFYGCGQNDRLAMTGPDLSGGGVAPAASSNLITLPFDANNFVNPKANPFFPLTEKTYTYRGVSKKGGIEINTVHNTDTTKTILGVVTTVVHDIVFLEDGSIAEDTYDWYAADNQGNVWYFGEDTKEYDHGQFITDAGSWEAGKNGARPGLIMLANPHVGDVYKQEDAPGVVEDMGKVISLTESVTVPYGSFTNCLETTEWTPIEPGIRSHKFYAAGVGNVLEISTKQGGERVELISVK